MTIKTSPLFSSFTANLVITTISISLLSTATAYTNHTVGGGAGWFFNRTTNSSVTDYSKWASSQSFSLGDFLIFNTNSNETVIQTYNATTFRACNADDASDSDTFVYSAGNDQINKALIIAVPLTIEGPNYYFSDVDDGAQCQQGMGFEISVKHGQGLPESLNRPPPPPYVAPPSPDSAVMTPSTVVPTTGQQERFYNEGFRIAAANLRLGFGASVIFLAFLRV